MEWSVGRLKPEAMVTVAHYHYVRQLQKNVSIHLISLYAVFPTFFELHRLLSVKVRKTQRWASTDKHQNIYTVCPLLTLDPSFSLGPKRACAVHVLRFIIFKDNTPFDPSAQFVSGRIVKKQENLLNPTLFSRSSKIASCCSFFCRFFPYVATGKCWWKWSCQCFRAKC